MSLSLGSLAPFGRPTGGYANFEIPSTPAHLLYLHDLPQRITGRIDGSVIARSDAARMLHETRMLPRWYLPRQDVVADLEPSDTTTHCPFKGDARYWHVRVGDRLIADAFWEYAEPLAACPPIAGLLAPDLDKLPSWWEEDEPVLGHPRDPFHRVDLRRSSRHLTVAAGGTVVASTERPLAVDETGLPTRWYVPLADVVDGALTATATTTVCPYKGTASYWSVPAGGEVLVDEVWAYPAPIEGMERLAGHVCFADHPDVRLTLS